ncbi:CsoS2 family carboxysome shell protein [Candidatus Thioglobus sp.]|uniref:CsoS2 family carboxysome shell protein n=1 Tax=Candidatus Thioglobus sp. TaxID=2026721 RepID=UPI003D0A8C68
MSNSTNNLSGRAQALARRKDKNSGSSSAPAGATRTRKAQAETVIPASTKAIATTTPAEQPKTKRPARTSKSISVAEGRAVAKQRRKQGTSGQTASKQSSSQTASRVRPAPEEITTPREKTQAKPKNKSRAAGVKPQVKTTTTESSAGRNLSKARRKTLTKGKSGATAYKTQSGQSSSIAKITNPDASTRDIAKAVRNERCSQGKKGCSTSAGSSKRQSRRKAKNNGAENQEVSNTLSGQLVSGTKVGQGQITGAETGVCKTVTGSEYLGVEEFKTHCSTTPKASPAKVAMTQTSQGQTVSGIETAQSQTVTGDNAASSSTITGTEYVSANKDSNTNINVSGANAFPEQSGSIQPSSQAGHTNQPSKAVAATTLAGNMMTGTQTGRGQAVTGDERGQTQSITGAGYQENEKTVISGTFAGQVVTGDHSGGVSGLTGASAGNCQAVSGSSYVDVSSFTDNCSAEARTSVMQRAKQIKAQNTQPLTGVQPGLTGLTGAQKGACEVVSGSPYQGADQTSQMCESTQPAMPGESDFPQVMSAANNQVAFSQPAAAVQVPAPATTITGDGWDKGDKVTGTDGAWAAQRNPSIRGGQTHSPMGAANFRPHAMPEVPVSPITGSSGNTGEGSKVTLSGGARA